MLKTFSDIKDGDIIYHIIYNTLEGGRKTGWIREIRQKEITSILKVKIGLIIHFNDETAVTVLKENLNKDIEKIIYDNEICCNTETVKKLLEEELSEFTNHHVKWMKKLENN